MTKNIFLPLICFLLCSIVSYSQINYSIYQNPISIQGKTGPVITKKMTNFNPKVHGFKFSNRFNNHGFVAGANINFAGLCGGMSYAALDYYHASVNVPGSTRTPNEGTQLTNFIRSRQWKTYETQGTKWAEYFINPFGWRTQEFWNWGIQGSKGGQFQALKKSIDQGKPVVLGLYAAGEGGWNSAHHQVIAIGYDMGRYKGNLGAYKNELKIYICDPNYPLETKILRPNSKTLRYKYDGTTKEWLTYFVDPSYRSVTPLDPDVVSACTNTNFTNSNQSGRRLNNKNFRCAKAEGADFRGATISGSDFYEANLNRAYFYGANCMHTNFEGARLVSSNFEGADLKNTTFSNTNLTNARFYGADLKFVKMREAKAEGANFQGADLHRGELCYTNFKSARLYGASLNTANCAFADFANANLDGADLRGASLLNANFKGAIITRNTKYDPAEIKKVRNWPGIR